MNTATPATLTLAEVIADFNHLPPLPRVAMELMDYLQSSDVDPEHVARLLAGRGQRGLVVAPPGSSFWATPAS